MSWQDIFQEDLIDASHRFYFILLHLERSTQNFHLRKPEVTKNSHTRWKRALPLPFLSANAALSFRNASSPIFFCMNSCFMIFFTSAASQTSLWCGKQCVKGFFPLFVGKLLRNVLMWTFMFDKCEEDVAAFCSPEVWLSRGSRLWSETPYGDQLHARCISQCSGETLFSTRMECLDT